MNQKERVPGKENDDVDDGEYEELNIVNVVDEKDLLNSNDEKKS